MGEDPPGSILSYLAQYMRQSHAMPPLDYVFIKLQRTPTIRVPLGAAPHDLDHAYDVPPCFSFLVLLSPSA